MIQDSIKAKIEKWKNCEILQRLWAMSTQLLKSGILIYDDKDEYYIRIQKGNPQGCWLSPMFFIMALDFILKHKDSITSEMLLDEKLLTFADDVIVSIKPNETKEIELIVNHLKQYGLITNQQKWDYISSQKYKEIDRFAKHQNYIKYLDAWITLQ